MYKLLEITCVKSKINESELFSGANTLSWLAVAEDIKSASNSDSILFAISICNKLYLLVTSEEVTPLRFIINGIVSKSLGSTASLRITAFDTILSATKELMEISEVHWKMFGQLKRQHFDSSYSEGNSYTGASLDFTDDNREPRWNGDSYLPALSPLAEPLLTELEV